MAARSVPSLLVGMFLLVLAAVASRPARAGAPVWTPPERLTYWDEARYAPRVRVEANGLSFSYLWTEGDRLLSTSQSGLTTVIMKLPLEGSYFTSVPERLPDGTLASMVVLPWDLNGFYLFREGRYELLRTNSPSRVMPRTDSWIVGESCPPDGGPSSYHVREEYSQHIQGSGGHTYKEVRYYMSSHWDRLREPVAFGVADTNTTTSVMNQFIPPVGELEQDGHTLVLTRIAGEKRQPVTCGILKGRFFAVYTVAGKPARIYESDRGWLPENPDFRLYEDDVPAYAWFSADGTFHAVFGDGSVRVLWRTPDGTWTKRGFGGGSTVLLDRRTIGQPHLLFPESEYIPPGPSIYHLRYCWYENGVWESARVPKFEGAENFGLDYRSFCRLGDGRIVILARSWDTTLKRYHLWVMTSAPPQGTEGLLLR